MKWKEGGGERKEKRRSKERGGRRKEDGRKEGGKGKEGNVDEKQIMR